MILAPKRHGRCQHCERDIHQSGNGYWLDSDGFAVCMRIAGPGFVFHTPLPTIRKDQP